MGNTSELIQGLKDEKYDIAFCSMMENEPEVSFTPVGTQNLVVVIPKQHPLSGRGEVDLEEAAFIRRFILHREAAFGRWWTAL